MRDWLHFTRQAAAGLPAGSARVSSAENLSIPTPWDGLSPAERSPDNRYDRRRAVEVVCSELADLFPTAYVLIVTRGFRSAIVSNYSQYIRSGGSRPPYSPEPYFGRHEDALISFDYDFLLSLYSERFGGRLLVLPYELLQDDPRAFCGRIEDLLGIAHHPLPSEVVNSGLSREELSWYPRFTNLLLKAPIGDRNRRRIGARYLRALNNRRLQSLATLLQKVWPKPLVDVGAVPDSVLERFRGKAESLRENALYADYRAEYLLDA